MQPIRLKLTNFLSYRDAEIDLSNIDSAALTGENGSGKSSLLDAITFALFGEGTRGGARQMDAYVTTGADECRVEMEFELANQYYRIVRHRSIARNKSLLELFFRDYTGAWQAISGKNISDTDTKIAEILRMDYRTFTASAFVLQGKADSLTADMTDQERKEVLASILGLDQWDRVLEATRERSRSNKAEAQTLQAQAQRLEATVSEAQPIRDRLQQCRDELAATQVSLAESEAELAQLQTKAGSGDQIEAQVVDVRRQMRAAEQDKAALDSERTQAQAIIASAQRVLALGPEINRAVAYEAELAPQVDAMNKQAAEYDRISRELETVTRSMSAWDQQQQSTISRLTATIKANQTQASLLGRVPCAGDTQQACTLLAAARKASEDLVKQEAELADIRRLSNPHNTRYGQLSEAREAVNYDVHALDRLRRDLDTCRITSRRLPELQAATTRAIEAGERVTQIDDKTIAVLENIDALTAKREALLKQYQDAAEAKALLDHCTTHVNALRLGIQNRLVEIGNMEARLETTSKAAEELTTIRDKAAGLTEQQLTLDVLEQACSKRGGVPALIVENAVPEIERLANDVLSRVSAGRLSVRLDTQVEGKSTGTMQEVLRITVLDGGIERPYRNYSGAERFVVDISLRVALSKFLSHRAGAEIRTLVIDEGFGSLDAAGRQRIVEALDIIRRDFGLCLIITHLDELKDSMPHRITVVKTVNGSEVTVA